MWAPTPLAGCSSCCSVYPCRRSAVVREAACHLTLFWESSRRAGADWGRAMHGQGRCKSCGRAEQSACWPLPQTDGPWRRRRQSFSSCRDAGGGCN